MVRGVKRDEAETEQGGWAATGVFPQGNHDLKLDAPMTASGRLCKAYQGRRDLALWAPAWLVYTFTTSLSRLIEQATLPGRHHRVGQISHGDGVALGGTMLEFHRRPGLQLLRVMLPWNYRSRARRVCHILCNVLEERPRNLERRRVKATNKQGS